MALLRYHGVDAQGTPIEGFIEARSADKAKETLQERGFQVEAIVRSSTKRGFLTTRLTPEEVAALNDLLLAVFDGGRPVAPSLRTAAKGRSRRLRRLVNALCDALEAGKTFEEAILDHACALPSAYVSLVWWGARSERLVEALGLMAARPGVSARAGANAVWPMAGILGTATFCFAIVSLLLIGVVPPFADIFREFGGHLPAPTMLVINLSRGSREFLGFLWALGLGAALCIVWLAWTVGRGRSGGYVWDWVMLHLPSIGRRYAMDSLTRFTRALALLLGARVPAIEALDLAKDAAGNAVLRRAVDAAAVDIAHGATIADGLLEGGYFGHGFCWTVATAEQSDRLGTALSGLAEAYETELTLRGSRGSWVQVLLVVGTVFFIGFVVVAVFLPIFTLGDAVSAIGRK